MKSICKKLINIFLVASLFMPTTTFALQSEAGEDDTLEKVNEIEEVEWNVEATTTQEPTVEVVGGAHESDFDKELNATISQDAFSADKAPSSYSLVSLSRVSSVRNQNPYGTCWAHASIASAESSAITQGLATTSIDLSELQVAYFVYHRTNDPLGLTHGDTVIDRQGTGLNTGGNVLEASMMYVGGLGFVNESQLPYSYASMVQEGTYTPDYSLAYSSNSYLVNETVWLNPEKNQEAIKQVIMSKGAMSIEISYNAAYFNSSTNAYYCNQDIAINHAVTIVGWNDDYATTNFLSTARPSAKGAWLIRNSWGTGWGDGGYF